MNVTDQKLFLFFLRRFVVETTGLNDFVVDIELVPRTGVHGFLDTLLSDESEDKDGFRLTDTMGTILGLKIGVGIPTMQSALAGDHMYTFLQILTSHCRSYQTKTVRSVGAE